MSELARAHEAVDHEAAKTGAPERETAPAPQMEADRPWPSPLAHAIGSKESWQESLSVALNFTDQRSLGETGIEGFILAEQVDHLHTEGGGAP